MSHIFSQHITYRGLSSVHKWLYFYVFIENTRGTSNITDIVQGFQVLKHHSQLQNSVLSITILSSHLSTTSSKASSDAFDSSASNVSISSRQFATLHYGTGQPIFPCIWASHPKYNALPHQDSDTLSRYLLEYKWHMRTEWIRNRSQLLHIS